MSNDRIVMGFDVGGTKTACIILNEQGCVLGRGFGGSGNTNFIPLEIANQSFTDAIENVPPEICRIGAEVAMQNEAGDMLMFHVTRIQDG